MSQRLDLSSHASLVSCQLVLSEHPDDTYVSVEPVAAHIAPRSLFNMTWIWSAMMFNKQSYSARQLDKVITALATAPISMFKKALLPWTRTCLLQT